MLSITTTSPVTALPAIDEGASHRRAIAEDQCVVTVAQLLGARAAERAGEINGVVAVAATEGARDIQRRTGVDDGVDRFCPAIAFTKVPAANTHGAGEKPRHRGTSRRRRR
jgi:hypothetical protein